MKRIRFEDLLARIRQDVRDNVADNVRASVNNVLGDDLSNDYDSNDSWLDRYESPICFFHGFVLRSNHKRLRLKLIELKRIRFEELLARICQDVCDNVADNVRASVNNALGDDLSNDSDSNDRCLDRYESD